MPKQEVVDHMSMYAFCGCEHVGGMAEPNGVRMEIKREFGDKVWGKLPAGVDTHDAIRDRCGFQWNLG